jgi:diguanylate cyclase (GGDEF)-like protein
MSSPHEHDRAAGETGGAADKGEAFRVILVGRTGLDGRLRLDPHVELVRVKTALEAVGELSDPIDSGSPAKSVVIIAPDAEPGKQKAAREGASADFVAALRRVDPKVRVLRLENGEVGNGDFDGQVNAAGSAEAIRAAVRGETLGEDASPEEDDPPEQPPPLTPVIVDEEEEEEVGALVDSMLSSKKPAAMSEVGDEPLLRLLMQGKDITDLAVEIIRRRMADEGGQDIGFVTSGRTGRDKPTEDAPGGHEAAVSWRGRLLGRLRSRTVPPERMAAQAAWLGMWLAMRDQHVQLRDAAFTDPLTGAYNRRFFDHFLGAAIEQAKKERRTLTVLMFDIDNFKQFNDLYGHAAGDDILIQVVKLMRSVIRPTDKVCRIGGDEFVVIFWEPTGPRTATSRPPSDLYGIAQRFQKEIAAHKFPKLGREAPGALTISGGLATYPWDGANAGALLEQADELSLRSKREGKNAITLGPGEDHGNGGA